MSEPSFTTYRNAINEIRKRKTNASPRDVHMYKFNIRPDQLESAYSMLDKDDERRSMRVTDNEDYNFIVKYMPSAAHKKAHLIWSTNLVPTALSILSPDIACSGTGVIRYRLGPKQKEADAGIEPHPNPSRLPSIIMLVGVSESLTQLSTDARYWLEHSGYQIMLVIILSIDSPIPPLPNFPRIRIELYRASAGLERIATNVWSRDWTAAPTPFYILLSHIFRGAPPAAYGNFDRVFLDTHVWRAAIIENLKY